LTEELDFLLLFKDNRCVREQYNISMEKQELKQKIREAIEQSEFKDDIQKVSLFGSYAYGTPREDSDVDLLIEFTPMSSVGFFRLYYIQEDLENRVQKKLDLITPKALSKFIRDDVASLAEPIYEKNGKK